MLKIAIGLAVLSLLLGVFGFTRLSGSSPTAYACTIALPERSIDVLAGQADAVALIDVVAAGGAENRAPEVARKSGGSSNAAPAFDLAGYGASAHVVQVYSGSLPADLEIDQSWRREMESGLREQEAGKSFPCPLNFLATRYTSGGRYLALLDKDGDEVSTVLAYRVDGDQVVVADKFASVGEGPQPLLVSKALYQRFLPVASAHAFDPDDFDTSPVSEQNTSDPIWTTSAGVVPVEALVQTIVAAKGPHIRPPTAGEGQ